MHRVVHAKESSVSGKRKCGSVDVARDKRLSSCQLPKHPRTCASDPCSSSQLSRCGEGLQSVEDDKEQPSLQPKARPAV